MIPTIVSIATIVLLAIIVIRNQHKDQTEFKFLTTTFQFTVRNANDMRLGDLSGVISGPRILFDREMLLDHIITGLKDPCFEDLGLEFEYRNFYITKIGIESPNTFDMVGVVEVLESHEKPW